MSVAWDQTVATMVGGPFDCQKFIPLSSTLEVVLEGDIDPDDPDAVIRRGWYRARRHEHWCCCQIICLQQPFVILDDGSVPFDYSGPE